MSIYSRYLRSLTLFLLAVFFFPCCERRPLEEKQNDVAMILFKIDWSNSGLDVSKMNRATIRVFPHDSSPAYDFRMQESLTQAEVPLPVGKYSFIIFNETIDPEDWNSLVFTGKDKYDQFMVTTLNDTFRGLYSRADETLVLKSPDALACWSIDEFEVTKEMILFTRSRTKAYFVPQEIHALEQQLEKVSNITPVSVVKSLTIKARVQNLASAQKSSGAVSGATQGIYLSTRKPIGTGATHIFIMNGREYDDPAMPKDGTIGASILVFDIENTDDLKYELTLDFLLHNGEQHTPEVFDITKDIRQDRIDININVGFDAGGEVRPDDRPIVLPDVPIGNGDVFVDGWGDDVIVPIG